MGEERRFLVIDDNADGRNLLARTLQRKFPGAKLFESADEDIAMQIAAEEPLDAIVLHRTAGVTGVELIQTLQRVRPTVALVMVSSVDREQEARAAGAAAFLLYDEWLRLGLVIEALLAPPDDAGMAESHERGAGR